MANLSKTTKDHEEIRRWAEERGGKPSHVKSTGSKEDIGILRIDFPGFSGEGSLEPITWDEFFEKFDERGLALIYQEETVGGERSNFNKIVSSETADDAESRSGGNGRSRSGGSRKKSGGSSKGSASQSKRSTSGGQSGRATGRSGAASGAKKSGATKKSGPSSKKSAPAKKGGKTASKKSSGASMAKKGAATSGRGAKKSSSKKSSSRNRR
jgi:hypothetical protein